MAPDADDFLVLAAAGTTSPSRRDGTRLWINDCLHPQTPVRHGTLSPSMRRETDSSLFVIDERLVFAVSSDYYLENVFVSNTAADWSQLEEIDDLSNSA